MTNPLILGSLPSAPLSFIGLNIYWCLSRRAVATPKRVMARPSSAGKGDDFASMTILQALRMCNLENLAGVTRLHRKGANGAEQ